MAARRLIAPALAALLAAPAVDAADLDRGAVLPPLPALEPAPAAGLGGGWYLRGDIGYAAPVDPKTRLTAGAASVPLSGASLEDAAAFGLGFGYDFGWLRADVTVDHRFGAQARLFQAGSPDRFGEARLSSTAALANAYLDLGTWAGFTPYVGAGVGVGFVGLHGYESRCAAPCVVGGVDLATAAFPDRTRSSFAYAFMAGVAVDAGRSLTVDLGYRFLNLGEGATGAVAGAALATEELRVHEARVGVRWTFDDAPAPLPARGPLSRAF